MDRNAPCPCGSGKKYKKCHGAAVPPEAAALPADARAEWLRGDVLLQRQKRVGQELLDWADRKLGPEWIDAALDAWGVHEDEDIDEGLADLFTAWSLFNYPAPFNGSESLKAAGFNGSESLKRRPIAAAWLDDAAGRRADEDTRRLVAAALDAPLGLWEVETVEAGVGATLTDRLTDTTLFVHEPDLTHDLGPSEYLLAYVLEVEGLRVFSGLHADTLVFVDGKELLADILADAAVAAPPLPEERRRDPAWQLRLARRFSETAALAYADDSDPDAEPDADETGA